MSKENDCPRYSFILVVCTLLSCSRNTSASGAESSGGAPTMAAPPSSSLYARCRTSLNGREADPRRYRELINEFANATENRLLRVNEEPEEGKFNLLLPDPALQDDAWPAEACKVGAWPPNCLAEPETGSVVCNPAMAARILSPRLHAPTSLPTLYAERFIAYFVLGHELAHLRRYGGGMHGALPDAGQSLTCRPAVQRSLETDCDEAGLIDAIKGIQALPFFDALSTSINGPLDLVNPLEASLDRDWFSIDDTCVGDASYPSMMRRKYRLREAYLDAFGGPTISLLQELHKRESADYLAFEALLREPADVNSRLNPTRPYQVYGFASSPRYGTGWAGEQAVLWSEPLSGLVSFDEGSTRSGMPSGSLLYFASAPVPPDRGRVAFERLHSFGGHVDLLTMASSPDGVELVTLATHEATRTLSHVRVVRDAGAITAKVHEARVPSKGEIAADASGRIAVVRPDHVQLFDSPADLDADRAAAKHQRQLSAEPNEVVSFVDGRLIIATIPAVPGAFIADVFTVDRALNIAFAIPDRAGFSGGVTPAVGIVGLRLIAAQQNDTTATLHVIMCPVEVLTKNGKHVCDLRHINQWSGLAPAYVTHDIGALVPAILQAPPSCGVDSIELRIRGLSWLFDPTFAEGELLPGSGIAACDVNRPLVWTWRARRVDVLLRPLRPSVAEKVTVDAGVSVIR